MKILIAVADYPSKEKIAMMYVHTRNLYYKKYGLICTPTQKLQLQQSLLIATHLSYLFHMHQESDHDIY